MTQFTGNESLGWRGPIAIDARLVQTNSGGDRSYWTGLLYGISRIAPKTPLLLISNVEKPVGIPWCDSWHWLTVPAKSSRLWSLVQFPLAARKHKAQVIHTQYNVSPLAGDRAVTTIHDVSFFIGPQWFSKKDLFLLQKFVPKSVQRSRAVITVSETSKEEILTHIPAAKGKTYFASLACPPWIERQDGALALQRLKDKFGIDRPFFFSLGMKWPRKNQELSVNAVQKLPAALNPLLVVAGKGSETHSKGSCILGLGYVSAADLNDLYSAASLFIFPSFHEGFGLPILEAFQCGCPVICGNGGAMPEVAGGAALVKNDYDPDSWAASIGDLLSELSKLNRMREKGMKRVKDFSWEDCACKTLNIYQTTMN